MNNFYFSEELIKINHKAKDKESALLDLIELFEENDILADKERFKKNIFERENVFSTGIGKGLGIPHCRSNAAKALKIAVSILKDPIDFDSIDGEPVKAIFMIAIPSSAGDKYMKLLQSISKFYQKKENQKMIFESGNAKHLITLLKDRIGNEN